MTKWQLHEVYWVKKNIKHMEERLAELESQATKITTHISLDPKGTNQAQDKLGEIVSKIVELQDEINYELANMYSMENDIEKAISVLPAREAYLMRLRYIESHSWERICVEMNYSWKQVHRIHGEALKLIA